MTQAQPFQVTVSDETLDAIRAKVAAFPWHEMPDDGGWEYGANLDYMQELCAYWVNDYDWRAHEAAINRFSRAVRRAPRSKRGQRAGSASR